MARNEHHNPTVSSRRAVAPYNFVSLPAETLPAPELPDHDNYDLNSGYFDCVLETSSPTYIRGMQKIDLFRQLEGKKPAEITVAEKIERAPFFKARNTAQIPGSSLRGLFRTLVEVISWSRPLAVSSDPLVYRSVDTTSNGIKYRNRLMEAIDERTFRPRIKAGYMRRRGGEWYIQPALEPKDVFVSYARIRHELLDEVASDLEVVKANWEHVHRIYVKVDAPTYQPVRKFLSIWYARVTEASATPKKGFLEAVVAKSDDMQSKKSEAIIFPADPSKASTKDWIPVSDELVYQYRENISQKLRDFLGKQAVLQDGYPVFYLMEDGALAAFGHCQMLRLPYHHAPRDLVPQEVQGLQQPDLAEAVFGYAGKDYPVGDSRAGRVSFSDAKCLPDQENIFLPIIRPQVLSGPKPTSFQLYLTQQDPDNKDNLQDYDSDASIRGTKFYWHKGARTAGQIETTDPRHESQYTRIQPVRAGVKFKFRIHFHNLTDLELGLLGWALTIAQNESTRLKLGMGKPLGMGAVLVTKAEPRLIDRECRYGALFREDEQRTLWNSGVQPDVESKNVVIIAKNVYKQWILAQPAANPKGASNFAELPRIRELLQVLVWPGPTPPEQFTRYQSMQRKEFRDRTVLPTPEGVLKNLPNAPVAPTPHSSTPHRQLKQAPSQPAQPTTPAVPIRPSRQAEDLFAQFQQVTQDNSAPSPEAPLPKVGEIVTAEVIDNASNGTLFTIQGQPDQILGWISQEKRGARRFSEGQEISCRVAAPGRQDGSDTIFDLEPVD